MPLGVDLFQGPATFSGSAGPISHIARGKARHGSIQPGRMALMRVSRTHCLAGFFLALLPVSLAVAQQKSNPAMPAIPQLMQEVHEHQKALEKLTENYTFSASQVTQDLDSKGRVTKTETLEIEEFFVNGHQIGRLVKRDGKPLEGHDLQKETERVTKEVEKAEKPEPDQPKADRQLSLSHVLEFTDVRNPRREIYRGRPTFVFDFVGRKDLKAHGISEDISKKLQGTVWIDEADRIVAHLDVSFNDNFHVGGGLLANIERGTNFHFDQIPVNGEVWLQSGVEATVQIRILLVKGFHQHFTERDHDYKRFRVETPQAKDAKVVPVKTP